MDNKEKVLKAINAEIDMERHEALRLIISELDAIVPYLRQLEAILKPKFEKQAWKPFDVGVDVVETAISRTPGLVYCVVVYDTSGTVSAHRVTEVVEKAITITNIKHPKLYSVVKGPLPYPVVSHLNLQFLEDLMAATAKA